MADDEVNEDQWLYGDSNPEKSNEAPTESDFFGDKFQTSTEANLAPPGILEPPIIEPPQRNLNAELEKRSEDNERQDEGEGDDGDQDRTFESGGRNEDGEIENDGAAGAEEDGTGDGGREEEEARGGDEEDDDEDSEDDVNVVIGEIKTTSQYSIKRGGLLTTVGGPVPQLRQPGKFSIEEFETIGSINGVPAHDYSIDSIEDKPWRKPGADITDYFNYGFNEETWRAYCERQKRLRVQESGVGLGQLSGLAPPIINAASVIRGSIPVTIVNDNSKYAAVGGIAPVVGPRKAGPPPGRRVAGPIDVIGLGLQMRREESPPKGNVIQVMTADRREYSRKAGFPDLSLPPPMPGMPPPGFEPPPFPPPSYGGEYYNSEIDPYYQAYEPTQDSQWMNAGWEQGELKVSAPPPGPPPGPPTGPNLPTGASETSNQDSQEAVEKSSASVSGSMRERGMSKEKDRDRSERERERAERHRERSHRHRSRSRSTERTTERRSRKHKSRSRSPGHRSHKKKKSKKSERAKEESD